MSLRSMLMAAAGASDTLPDSFTFTSKTGAEISTVYSTSYLPVGYDESTWTVSNGEGSTDGSTWATSGKITKGQTFYIRATSSSSYSTVVTATATFGGYLSATYSITTRAEDVVPNAFTINSTTGVNLSTLTTSGQVTVSGMDPSRSVTVTVTGGDVDAGTSSLSGVWSSSKTVTTSGTGTIVIAARGTSSASYSTSVNVTVTISGVSATYTITTKAVPSANAFSFTDQPSATLNTVYTSNQITVTGFDSGQSVTVTASGGTVDAGTSSLSGSYSTSKSVTASASGTIVVSARATSSGSYSTAVNCTVTVTTLSSVSDTYTVTTKTAPTPAAFSFNDVTGASVSTVYTSGTLTLTGLDSGQSITVSASGGTVDAGTTSLSGIFASSKTVTASGSGTIVIAAQVTSSASYNVTVNCTVTAGSTSDTYSVTTINADTVPNQFTFTDKTGAEINTYYSTSVTPIGYDSSTWTVSGGEGSTNGSTWSTSGSITSGQTFYVRGISSGSYSTSVNVTANIGGVSDIFTITTRAVDTVPVQFTFTDQSNAERSTVYSTSVVPTGYDTASWSVTGGEGSTNGSTWSTSGSISSGQTFYIRGTSSSSFSTAVNVSATIGGISDTYTITTRAVDTTPNAFSFTTPAAVNPGITANYTSYYTVVTVSGLEPNYSLTVSASGGNVDAGTSALSGTYAASKTVTTSGTGTLVVSPQVVSSSTLGGSASVTITIGSGSGTWTVNTRAADTTPNAYTFTALTNQALSSTITSALVTVTGLEPSYGVSWSVTGSTGASASVAGSAYGTSGTATTDASGQLAVYARVTSSSIINTQTYADVTIGSGTATRFSVTTANLVGPSAYTITTTTGANPSSTQTTSFSLSGMAASAPYTASVTSGTATLSSDNVTFSTSISFTSSGTGTATLYIRDTASASYNTSKSSTVSVNSVTATWTLTTRAADLVPDQFTFTDQTGVDINKTITSTQITVSGMDSGQSITVSATGGTIDAGTSALSGTYAASKTVTTSGTGTIVLSARVTSSGSWSTAVNCTVSIGTVSDIFTVTTMAQPSGSQSYTTAGTYNWTVPAGVYSICVLAVSGGGGGTTGGGGGGGGGLSYINNYSVTPTASYPITVGAGGAAGASGGDSQFNNATTLSVWGAGPGSGTNGGVGGSPRTSTTGFSGGAGGNFSTGNYGGGGGAAGYAGAGGKGGSYATAGAAGTGGAGGGGGYGTSAGGSGGGVGISVQGTNGSGGTNGTTGVSGGGGSGGSSGSTSGGGAYGGGGAGGSAAGKPGASGAVRIIWGAGRSFPSNSA